MYFIKILIIVNPNLEKSLIKSLEPNQKKKGCHL